MAELASYFFPPKRKKPDAPGFVGVSVTVAGREYRGGYCHGPLTSKEITDLILAGHGHRIVQGDPARPPRRHPDDA
ncbi:MAG: hypothetical protein ACRDHJ_03770 [Actinomycetota bacterium]